MNKIVDAVIVATLLMLSTPDLPRTDLPADPPAQMTEVSHGDRPC